MGIMSVNVTDKNGKLIKVAGNFTRDSALPIGLIFASAVYLDNPAFKLLNGQIIVSDGAYADFYNWATAQKSAGNISTCTEDEFNSEVNAYGQCGKFVIGEDYVRLPLITEFIGSNNGGLTLGLAELDSLRMHNHPFTGTAATISGGTHYHTIYGDNRENSGTYALKFGPGKSTQASQPSHRKADGNYASQDGSHSHSYTPSGIVQPHGGAKTQPLNIRYPYYIVVANAKQIDDVAINVDNVMNDVNDIASRTAVLEAKHTVISYNTTLNLTAGTWIDTGITANSLQGGLYLFYALFDGGGPAGLWGEAVGGTFVWYAGGTNSSEAHNIPLTQIGHAPNGNTLQMRLLRQSRSTGNGSVKLQVYSVSSGSVPVNFKFIKML